ncbi:N-acetylmuramoyl-L-alanine amidase [Tunicatimonas pelagia]|uniref:N-acetylmuramoyl-L-alanine amidase n=1 Tax=Tunicatimonas pelagia TaxID=931531 RepID=UPI002666759D|nr:N-acetylmuramoyl-L-alanine amidase [Tunicatimonas pelagia]WKN40839.1 N-acetylmuramoyl-L-alanine amidase [Tunicatimonas pelagia]
MNRQPYILTCLIGLWLLPSLLWAQSYPKLSITETKAATKYYRQYAASVEQEATYQVQAAASFTSLAFRATPGTDWADTYVIVNQDTFRVSVEEHETANLPHSLSTLLVWDQPIREFLLYTGQLQDSIVISLFNAQASQVPQPALRREQTAEDDVRCEKPALITQEEWRTGLPAPSYQRAITQVNHVIIHHSATFNSLTDYENVVRNIYLFHTQDRGWSDIGYNFLVAPDGTLFEGRSAGEQNVESDNIRGAHFCGRNSGTMGVCLLGNYNTAIPTDTALATIERVTSWKLDKEGLDPMATNSHPANNNLGVIAGHRNGCATECPGENLYARLESIRLNTEEQIAKDCQEEPQVFNIYPVPNDGTLTVSLPQPDSTAYLDIIDLQGRTLSLPVVSEDASQFTIQTQIIPTGSYILRVTTSQEVLTRKILIE